MGWQVQFSAQSLPQYCIAVSVLFGVVSVYVSASLSPTIVNIIIQDREYKVDRATPGQGPVPGLGQSRAGDPSLAWAQAGPRLRAKSSLSHPLPLGLFSWEHLVSPIPLFPMVL